MIGQSDYFGVSIGFIKAALRLVRHQNVLKFKLLGHLCAVKTNKYNQESLTVNSR